MNVPGSRGMARPDHFARAIHAFLEEIQDKEDRKSDFYKEVLSKSQLSLTNDNSTENDENHGEEELLSFVKDLEARFRKDKKPSRIMEKLRPLIDGLSQFTSAYSHILVQAGPSPLMILYGSARLVLRLAQNARDCFEEILDIMKTIGDLLQCYKLFSSAYGSSENMSRLLVDAYKNIISFWHSVSMLYGRRSLPIFVGRLRKLLHADWHECHQKLLADRCNIQAFAQATEAERHRERDADTANIKQDNTRMLVGRWLRGDEDDADLDVRLDLYKNQDLHHMGTCSWLFSNHKFQSWLDAKSNSVFWYTAGPGTGKSVLCSAVIQHLQDLDLQTAYFFFFFNDRTKRKPLNAIRSIALQLLAQSKSIPDTVLQIYESEIKNFSTKLILPKVAIAVLQAFLKQEKRVHIVLDGVDECEDRVALVRLLTQAMSTQTLGVVKWFISSRYDPSLRPLSQELATTELDAPREAIMDDIRAWLKDNNTAEMPDLDVDDWVLKSDGNFLWMRLMRDILKGDGLPTDYDILQALKVFPKGLKGCYLLGLQKLLSRTEQEQELARRIYLILVVARQPLRRSELSHALGAHKKAADFSKSFLPREGFIEDLCGSLVQFDRVSRGSAEDPILKLAHKSVQEFFTQDPNSLDIPEVFRKFFVGWQVGNLEMGQTCLTYLNYARYQRPLLSLEMLENDAQNEHAFLKYASTFWFQHLHYIIPCDDICTSVQRFCQSPAFWNCLAVQARVAPHLFGTFTEKGCGSFELTAVGSTRPDMNTNIHIGSPIPLWFGTQPGSSAQAVARDLWRFIMEWQPILTMIPQEVGQCCPKVAGRGFLGPNTLIQSKQLQTMPLTLTTMPFSGTIQVFVRSQPKKGLVLTCNEVGSHLEVLRCSQGLSCHGSDLRLRKLKTDQTALKTHLIAPPSIRSGNLLRSDLQEWNGTHNLYFFDPERLSFYSSQGSARQIFDPPKSSFSRTHQMTWSLQTRTIHHTPHGVAVAYHCIPKKEKVLHSDSGYASSAHSSSRNEDVSNSDSGSDWDYDSEPEPLPKFHPEYADQHNNCLVIVPRDEPPIWFPWKSSSRAQLQMSCAFHPTEPLAVWTHTPQEIWLTDLRTKSVSKVRLPEPVEIKQSPAHDACRELRFSSCGKILHYLVCSFEDKLFDTICSLVVSSFEFEATADSLGSLNRLGYSQTISSISPKLLKQSCPPFILTYWSTEELIIALPALSCCPKIICVTLPTNATDKDFEFGPIKTLIAPIYFPSSTPYRNPQLGLLKTPFEHSIQPSTTTSEHLVLVLDSHSTQVRDNEENGSFLPPIAMAWDITGRGGWREWDKDADEHPQDIGMDTQMCCMLRGTFVDSEQPFCVPIRSGLDFTRQAFVSCS